MIRNYNELKTKLINDLKFQEISRKDFEDKYPHYSLNGDKSPIIKYLKGIFVDTSGKINRRNDPFVLIVFARDDERIIGQRLNGGPEVVPQRLLDILDEVAYVDLEEY